MPEPARLTPLPIEENRSLSEAATAWFTSRGISAKTCIDMGVWSAPAGRSEDVIRFPYTTGGNVYALKIRSFPEKKFHCQGAPATFFGIDQVVPGEDLIAVEGEIDMASIREAGHRSVVSVPNGAPVQVSDRKIDPENDRKYAAVWSARKQLDEAKRIIIACDSDAPGQALAEELARRIGKARCWRVNWPEDCKDANDVLKKHGRDKLAELIANPEPWPVAGIYDVAHFADKTRDLFNGAMTRGESTGFVSVDEIFTVMPGHLSLITGAPGAGKSSWLNAVMVNMARDLGWKFAIHSTETPPDVHIGMLAQIYMGKSFFPHDGGTKMSDAELDTAIDWVGQHFYFLHADETPTYQDVIERLQAAVMRWGVRGFVADPVGYLAKPEGSEVEWAGQMLEAFRNFAQSHDCCAFLVAHPYKLRPREDGSYPVPRGWEVSGSSHYFNRVDNGITVHRTQADRGVTEIHVWKGRFNWVAREGVAKIYYEESTGRFSDQPFPYSGPKIIYSGLKNGFSPEDAFDFDSKTENRTPF